MSDFRIPSRAVRAMINMVAWRLSKNGGSHGDHALYEKYKSMMMRDERILDGAITPDEWTPPALKNKDEVSF